MAERAQLQEQGFVICQGLVSPEWLARLRPATELLVERHKAAGGARDHARDLPSDRRPGAPTSLHAMHPPGCYAGTASPYIEPLASMVGATASDWVEFWASEEPSGVHAMSSRLLAVEDASLASMEVLCQDPVTGVTAAADRPGPDAANRAGNWVRRLVVCLQCCSLSGEDKRRVVPSAKSPARYSTAISTRRAALRCKAGRRTRWRAARATYSGTLRCMTTTCCVLSLGATDGLRPQSRTSASAVLGSGATAGAGGLASCQGRCGCGWQRATGWPTSTRSCTRCASLAKGGTAAQSLRGRQSAQSMQQIWSVVQQNGPNHLEMVGGRYCSIYAERNALGLMHGYCSAFLATLPEGATHIVQYTSCTSDRLARRHCRAKASHYTGNADSESFGHRHRWPSARLAFYWNPLSIHVEIPTQGRGGMCVCVCVYVCVCVCGQNDSPTDGQALASETVILLTLPRHRY